MPKFDSVALLEKWLLYRLTNSIISDDEEVKPTVDNREAERLVDQLRSYTAEEEW